MELRSRFAHASPWWARAGIPKLAIAHLDAGADFTVALKGLFETAAANVSTLQADGGRGFPGQIVAAVLPTTLILIDAPLLRDVNDTGGIASRLYLAGAGYGEPGWRGTVLYASVEGTTWANVGTICVQATYGVTLNALPSLPSLPFCTDETSVLRVAMASGADKIESVTQAVMLNGANAALVIKGNGEPEAIQFRDALWDEGTGSFVLTGLLRGRRGTDLFIEGHAAGEVFVLLDPAWIEAAMAPLGDLNAPRLFRAVSVGALFEDAAIQPRIHTGRDLKPYAPWAVKAASSAAISSSRGCRVPASAASGRTAPARCHWPRPPRPTRSIFSTVPAGP